MHKIIINPENGSLSDIDETYRSTANKHFSIRLLAIRSLQKGKTIDEVADFMNVTPRTIYNWIRRWNKGGIDALANEPKSGRPRIINDAERVMIIDLIDNPSKAGQTHWTAVKLCGYLKAEKYLELGYSTFARWLHEQDYCLKVPRPWSTEQDAQLRQDFINQLDIVMQDGSREVWFADESGFLADPRPRRIWAKRGSKPTTPSNGLHLRQSIIGAVCPSSGVLAALVVEYVNSDVFQVFLDQLSEETRGRKVTLVLDNASWHKTKMLNWYDIDPMYLPPYSPDLNPIERLWLLMKANFFTQWYTKDRETLFNRVMEAVTSFIIKPESVKSICAV